MEYVRVYVRQGYDSFNRRLITETVCDIPAYSGVFLHIGKSASHSADDFIREVNNKLELMGRDRRLVLGGPASRKA